MATRLDRTQVVDTALRLLNEVGLEGLTLRRIAKELNVQAPALYWHFKNKQELLDEMATAIMRSMTEHQAAAAPAADWREYLTDVHRLLRRTLLGYRDGARVFAGTRFTDTGYAAGMDAYLRVMTGAGFTAGAAARAGFVAHAFTLGFLIEEQAVIPVPGERTPGYDTEERAERIGEEYPLAAAVGGDLFADYEARFEEGLRAVVAGIAATFRVN